MYLGTLPAVSNKATWSESFELTDAETGELIDLSAVDEITIEVRATDSGTAELSGTLTGTEVVVISSGVFQWRFEAAQMRNLCAKTYEVGCVIEQDDDEVQLLIGTLAVLDGIVR